jgi:hypothetical protein
MENKNIYIRGLCCPYCESPLNYNFDYTIFEKNLTFKNEILHLCIDCHCNKTFLAKIFNVNNIENPKGFHFILYDGNGVVLNSQQSEPKLIFGFN